MTHSPALILYSSLASQWANVPKLGLAEIGFAESEVEIKEIDLLTAENFHPDYLKINPNGTVPSLVISAQKFLVDSREILEYLDHTQVGNKKRSLAPDSQEAILKTNEIVELVHSADLDTNLILLRARDLAEYENKRDGPFGAYIATRQKVLEDHSASYPEHSFYGPKSIENGLLHRIYTTGPCKERDNFFGETHEGYVRFSSAIDRLESQLVLPYTVGDTVSYADLHVAPWLSHALAGVGTQKIKDLSLLEKHLQKSVPDFKIGPKLQTWWNNYTEREAFKNVFPTLH